MRFFRVGSACVHCFCYNYKYQYEREGTSQSCKTIHDYSIFRLCSTGSVRHLVLKRAEACNDLLKLMMICLWYPMICVHMIYLWNRGFTTAWLDSAFVADLERCESKPSLKQKDQTVIYGYITTVQDPQASKLARLQTNRNREVVWKALHWLIPASAEANLKWSLLTYSLSKTSGSMSEELTDLCSIWLSQQKCEQLGEWSCRLLCGLPQWPRRFLQNARCWPGVSGSHHRNLLVFADLQHASCEISNSSALVLGVLGQFLWTLSKAGLAVLTYSKLKACATDWGLVQPVPVSQTYFVNCAI